MASEVRHCPYNFSANSLCNLSPRYDTTAPSDEAVESIVNGIEDDQVPEALLAASESRTYRGESCQRCGAWFPATEEDEE